ncbi:hypothetical protein HDU99_010096 [Rhizoclosmatium hyalinum]|nr:hypothetical protein HDU99_010096 [Rhizoclosmatium hyalinum]
MSTCICEPINFLKLILADERVGPSLRDCMALIQMAKAGFQDSVRLLLDDGRVDASNMNNLALRNAVSRNNSNIVQILLANDRVDPLDGGDDCALYLAIRAQNWACAELLLDDRRLVEQRKNYELILDAFERKRAEILMYFLKMEGFAVKNSQTFMGFVDWSPLSVCFNYLSMYEKFQAWQIQTTRMEELKVHVDSLEVMFKVLMDPLESSRAKFRAILTSWKSLCELAE